jgi:hypothetical protein
MQILFLHGWTSVPGGKKPTFLKEHGHDVLNPSLPDDDFPESVRIAEVEHNRHHPDVIVGSSRGGAVAMNMDSKHTPLVLLCPAWKNWGTATRVKANTMILHSRADDVIPFTDSEEILAISGLPPATLIEVGNDHRLADPEPLQAMLEACIGVCVAEWSDSEKELLQQEWDGLCYSAAMRWVTASKNFDWTVVHGSVMSEEVGKRIEHAWCEHGDIVVDLAMPVEARVVGRETYYRVIKPEVSKVYSSEDALVLSIKNGHQGPWDESEQLNHPPRESILDDPAVSGRYLCPQPRQVDDPFIVKVDGAELACYRNINDPENFTIVHFHGNGEAVADYVPDMADVFTGFGLNSLFVEYRQYGGSTGKAQLVAMLSDGEAAIKAAGLKPEKTIVFGRSIGSLYAIELVHRQPAMAGLILESGIADPSERFLIYADLSAAGVEQAEVVAETKRHFNHKRKLSEYRNPLLVMHTEKDGLVDISHAERSYRWTGSTQKRLLRFPDGNHNTILGRNWNEYMAAVGGLVKTIRDGGATSPG